MLTSAIVIRLLAPDWWGQITVLQLYMYLATQFCAWGNKDFLIKKFSENPSAVPLLWMESFGNRFFLLLPAMIGSFFVAPDKHSLVYLCIWLLLRFFSQAFEAPVVFGRKFIVIIFTEIIGIIVVVSGLIIYHHQASYNDVLLIITMGYIVRTFLQILYFRNYFSFSFSFLPDFKKLGILLPFMMLGFAGVMQQKSDMICVVWFCNTYEVAQYQVFSSFLILMQSVPALIAGPYIKNLYRISSSSYSKIQLQFAAIGLLVTSLISFLTYIAMREIYHFNLPVSFYLLGFLYGLLTYFYLLEIYLLFKENRQSKVMWISVLSIAVNFILCFIFIPVWNIEGAVVANVFSQVVLFVGYKYYWKHTQSAKVK